MECSEMKWVEMTKWRNSIKSSRKEKSHDCVQYGAACAVQRCYICERGYFCRSLTAYTHFFHCVFVTSPSLCLVARTPAMSTCSSLTVRPNFWPQTTLNLMTSAVVWVHTDHPYRSVCVCFLVSVHDSLSTSYSLVTLVFENCVNPQLWPKCHSKSS